MMTRFAKLFFASVLALYFAAGERAEAKFVFAQNHPDLEWYTIETDHYYVHYPISKKSKEEGNPHALTGEWSARKMAKSAEEIWPKMCAEFNLSLIHI